MSASRITGTISPCSSATATPTLICFLKSSRSPSNETLTCGTRTSASATPLTIRSLYADLDRLWQRLGVLVDRCAQLGQLRRVNRERQVEVWRGLHALLEPPRDGLAHRAERHRLDLFALGSGRHRRDWLRWSLRHGLNGRLLRQRRGGRLLLCQQRLNIVLDDAPVRTCAGDARDVKMMLLRRCGAQSG